MTHDPKLVQELFLAALQVPPGTERQQWLDDQCTDDPQLKQRVQVLLAAHDATEGFGGTGSIATPPGHGTTQTVHSGTLLAGRYKLLEPIGEGGMGTVWLAEQIEPVRRKVAIKLVKAGMDSKQVLARFEAERQALALMDHPNIAKVLDGGITAEGRPFFVMEYVKGIPLTEYCDRHQLTLRNRLELLVPICQAIQHAHQKGIIHRDLKPSNVLVCLYDGLPIPRVIDFGLAKAMHQPLTERTLFTGHGLVLGTPLYMSPEQAELNNLDVDTRSDVYSLGVLMYELLTGSTPLEKVQFQQAALTEILRMIKEVDPPKPSTRVSSSVTLPNIAAQRKLDPRLLSKAICGDLDWIVMKALDKDRSRRYETANALARDIQRFLTCEPVEACPPSTAYRLKKYYAKNRSAILTASGFAVLLAASAIVSGWQAFRATRSEKAAITAKLAEQQQRAQAEQQRDEAKKLEDEAVIRSAELQKLTATQRRSLYASDMNLVRIEADRGNLARMRELLNQQLPIHSREDLRGIEWSYWHNYLNQGKTDRLVSNFPSINPASQSSLDLLINPDKATVLGAILPNGELAAFSLGNETRIMRIASGEEIQRIPVAMTDLVNRTRFGTNARSVFAQANSMTALGSISANISPNVASGISIYRPGDDPIQITYPENTFSHISQVTLSRDGKFVAAIGNAIDHRPSAPSVQVVIWDIDSRQVVFNQNEKREFNRIELNHDASGVILHVAHGSSGKVDRLRVVASVWNVRRAKEVQSIQYDDDIESATWHPTQPIVYLTTLGFSGSNTKQLLRWSIVNNKLERFSSEVMPNFVRVEIRPDGRELAISSHGSEAIRLIDTNTGNVNRTLFHPESQVNSIHYTVDGGELVASTSQGHVIRWDLEQGPDLFGLRQAAVLPASPIRDWSFDRTFTQGAFCTTDGRIIVRHRSGREFAVDVGLVDGYTNLSKLLFSADGRYLAAWLIGFKNRNPLLMIDCQSGKTLWRQELATTQLISRFSVAFSPDQTKLFVCGDGKLNTLDVKSGTEYPAANDDRLYGDLVYDASHQRLLVGALTTKVPATLQIVDAMQRGTLLEMPVPPGSDVELKVSRLVPSPSGKMLIAIAPTLLTIWNLESQKAIYQTEGGFIVQFASQTSRFQFSADGNLAVVPVNELAIRKVTSNSVFSRIKRVDVIDLVTSSLVSSISLLGDGADDVKLSPDGKRLLSLHGKNPLGALEAAAKAKLWDLQSTRELLTVPLPRCNKTTWDMFYEPEHSALVALSFNIPFGSRSTGESVVCDTRPLSTTAGNTLIAEHLVQELAKTNILPEEVQQAIAQNQYVNDEIKTLATQFASRLTIDTATLAQECMAELSMSSVSRPRLVQILRKAKAIAQREPTALRSIAILSAVQYLLGDVDSALKLVTSTPSDASENLVYEFLRRLVEALCLEASSDSITHHKRLIAIADLGDRLRAQGISRIPAAAIVAQLFNRHGMEFTKSLLQDKPVARIRKPAASTASKPTPPADLWQFARLTLEKIDKNGDGQVSEDELPKRDSIDWREFDTDGNQTLDLVELSTFQRVTAVLSKAIAEPTINARFQKRDTDGDGRLTLDEFESSPPGTFQLMDTDKDNAVSKEEYQSVIRRNGVVAAIFNGVNSVPDEIQLTSFDYFLRLYPDEPNLLSAQAWVRSTSAVDKLRNGQLAVEVALKSLTNNGDSIPSRLDTLAAAYAETGDFEKAVQTQTKVVDMTNQEEKYVLRLELYKAGKPYREVPSQTSTSTTAKREKPVWDEPKLAGFKRIVGGEPCWSPDGKKILYALTVFGAEHSYFEVLDLATGQQQVVGRGGRNPHWNPRDSDMLAFDTSILETGSAGNESEVWLVRMSSDQRQTLGAGVCLGWSDQGMLLIRRGRAILQIDPAKPDEPKQILEGNLFTCAVSPDGLRLAFSKFGKWTICDLTSPSESINGYVSTADKGFTDWSPDGKYLLFGSSAPDNPGLWLIEAATGKRKLLAEIICKPRWSPDGKQIALGLFTSNEILTAELDSLELSAALQVDP